MPGLEGHHAAEFTTIGGHKKRMAPPAAPGYQPSQLMTCSHQTVDDLRTHQAWHSRVVHNEGIDAPLHRPSARLQKRGPTCSACLVFSSA